jgi:hypothetical protein
MIESGVDLRSVQLMLGHSLPGQLSERNDAGVTAVIGPAAISPICNRKYLKTALRCVGLQDAQAHATWLMLSTRRGVLLRIQQTNTNVADPNKPRCTESYKRIGPSLPSELTRSAACRISSSASLRLSWNVGSLSEDSFA